MTTTLRLPLRRALVALAVVAAASVAVISVGVLTGGREWAEVLSVTVWLVVPGAVGVAVKARRDATTEVRTALARRAVSEERLRLAREVHDVAGHGFAVIAMQAGVALRVLDRDPDAPGRLYRPSATPAATRSPGSAPRWRHCSRALPGLAGPGLAWPTCPRWSSGWRRPGCR